MDVRGLAQPQQSGCAPGGGQHAAALTRTAPPDCSSLSPLNLTTRSFALCPRAAWGTLQRQNTQLMCRSYELGVLLTPSMEAAYRASRWAGFSCTAATPAPAAAAGGGGGGSEPPAVRFVAWQRGDSQEAQADADGTLRVPLPIPYRLPPQRYAAGVDRPWMWDVEFSGVDTLGCTIDSPRGRHYGLLE